MLKTKYIRNRAYIEEVLCNEWSYLNVDPRIIVIPHIYTQKGPQSISHDAIILNKKKGQMIDKKARFVIKARKKNAGHRKDNYHDHCFFYNTDQV